MLTYFGNHTNPKAVCRCCSRAKDADGERTCKECAGCKYHGVWSRSATCPVRKRAIRSVHGIPVRGSRKAAGGR